MKIGVFDSGVGGKSVANAITKELSDAEVLFVHDTPEHFPYAMKSPDEIYGYILPIFQGFADEKCDVVVVACNTVSTTLIKRLRKAFEVPMVALEPMVKPAAAFTRSGVVCVCATPTTLASERYRWLKETYGGATKFIEPDCSDWSYLIEHNQMNEARIRQDIEPALEQGADVIVLGCTHYHWIENEVKAIAKDRARVIQPEQAVVAQVKRILNLA